MAEVAMIKPISQEEIAKAQIEGNLPDKPSQAPLYGGRTLTPQEIKAWYDKLPKLIAEHFNALVRAIPGVEDGKLSDHSLSAMIKTGVYEGHTLKDLFGDIQNGVFAQYLVLAEDFTLEDLFAEVREKVNSWGEGDPVEEASPGSIYAKISEDEIVALYMYVKNEDGTEGWKIIRVGAGGNAAEYKKLEKRLEKVEQVIENSKDVKFDDTLKYENGVIGVNVATEASKDNTLPITSAATYALVGNIEALFNTL